jgi:hypothetical protein
VVSRSGRSQPISAIRRRIFESRKPSFAVLPTTATTRPIRSTPRHTAPAADAAGSLDLPAARCCNGLARSTKNASLIVFAWRLRSALARVPVPSDYNSAHGSPGSVPRPTHSPAPHTSFARRTFDALQSSSHQTLVPIDRQTLCTYARCRGAMLSPILNPACMYRHEPRGDADDLAQAARGAGCKQRQRQ